MNEMLREAFNESRAVFTMVRSITWEDGEVGQEQVTRCTNIGLVTETVQWRRGHDSVVFYNKAI